MATKIEYQGILYSSMTELANKFNVNPKTLKYRLKGGMSIDEALSSKRKKRVESSDSHKVMPSNAIEINYNGKHYESLGQLCRDYDVKIATFSKRKSRGYTIDECLFGKLKSVK